MLMKDSTELTPVSDVALICLKFANQCKKKTSFQLRESLIEMIFSGMLRTSSIISPMKDPL